MSTTIERQTLPARHYLGIRQVVSADGIPEACGRCLPAAYRWMQAHGVEPAGPPMTVYHHHLPDAGAFDLQPGFFVGERVEPDPASGLTCDEMPAGDYAVAMHQGAYDGLGETWSRVMAWVAAEGRRQIGPAYELYLDDPGEVADPAALRTQIFCPMR